MSGGDAGLKSHGMDGTLVAPDWPALVRDEVDAVVREFAGMDGAARVVRVSPRPFSAACVVEVAGRRVFLKRHARVVRNGEALREEHRFMERLRERGAAVPEVLKTRGGDTVLEWGAWTYELHEGAAGLDVYGEAISWTPFLCVEHARAAGVALAHLHRTSQGYSAPARRRTPLIAGFTIYAADDVAAAMAAYLRDRPRLEEFIRGRGWVEATLDLLEPFAEELRAHVSALASLWTHNDWHASNLFWSAAGRDARVTAAIDFGLCDRTNAVHDLAHAIERNVVEWLALVNDPRHPEHVPVHMDHLWALLAGYESVRPLSSAERRSLAPMLAVCHAEFALSEADYYLTALDAPEKAFFACPRYLVEHAQYWRGAGAWVLDEIRAWAQGRPA